MKLRHVDPSSTLVSSPATAADDNKTVEHTGAPIELDHIGSPEMGNYDDPETSIMMSSSLPPSPGPKSLEVSEHSLKATWSPTDVLAIDGTTPGLTTATPIIPEDSSLILEDESSTLKNESLIDRNDHQSDDSLINIISDEEQETSKNLDNGDVVLGDVLELLEKSLGRRLDDQRSALPPQKNSLTPTRRRPLSSKLSGSLLSPPSFFSDMGLFRTSSPQHRDSDHRSESKNDDDDDGGSHGSHNARRNSSTGPLGEKENDTVHNDSTVDRKIDEKLTLQDFLMVSERKLPSKGNRRKKSGMNLFSKIFSNPLDDHEKSTNDGQPSMMTD
jgi:hypothetical protein